MPKLEEECHEKKSRSSDRWHRRVLGSVASRKYFDFGVFKNAYLYSLYFAFYYSYAASTIYTTQSLQQYTVVSRSFAAT